MINKVILIGNLGQDPEVKYTQSGAAVATLSVATSRTWKDKQGQKQEETEWHRVIVWNQAAEFCGKYLGKGDKVYVDGRLATKKWKDNNGADRYTTEVIANEIKSLTPRTAGEQEERTNFPPPPGGLGTGGDDQVPF